MIYSPVSGRVMELVACGDKVQPGEMLASITNSDIYSPEEEIRAYVSVTTAQSIKRGMKVRVYPQSSAGKQYGYIQGLVSDISTYPITETDIQQALGRFYHPDYIPQGDNIAEIRVTLMVDSEESTLNWSGSGEDNVNMEIGTMCTMEVVLRDVTLWEYLKR